MNNIFFENYHIFGANDSKDFFRGSLFIKDGKIHEIIKGEFDVSKMQKTKDSDFMNSIVFKGDENSIIMPSFINCHTHIYSTLARGMNIVPFNPNTFKELLEQLWWRLDKALTSESVLYSAYISAIEMINSGVTSFVDHHSSPFYIDDCVEKIIDVCVNEFNLKGIFCYEMSDRDGKEVSEKAYLCNKNLFEHVKKHPKKCASLFGLHASFTLSDDSLKLVSELGKPIHIHVAEGEEDASIHIDKFGISAIERLDKFGLLANGSLLSHCIKIKDSDLNILKDKDIFVAFNPQSNMNNGVGIADYTKFKEKGIRVVLGNDGYGYDITRDMRSLVLSQRLLKNNPLAFSLEDLFEVALLNNSKFINDTLGIKTGKILDDYCADINIYNYYSPTKLDAENFLSHFFFSIMENLKPTSVMSDGVFLKENNQVLKNIDMYKIYKLSQKSAEQLWKKL